MNITIFEYSISYERLFFDFNLVNIFNLAVDKLKFMHLILTFLTEYLLKKLYSYFAIINQ